MWSGLQGRVEHTQLDSRLLADNPPGDACRRDVYVYVPPGYDEGTDRYPVVMLLAGFASTNRSMLGYDPFKPNTVERFDRMVAAGECAPALLVLPDASNRWGGSQFVDSSATGRYQSYLADEVIPHVDARYRTVAARKGRAIVGRSSGGFGALRMGMDRPEVFSVLGSHAGDAGFEVSMRPMLPAAAIAFERAGGLAGFDERLQQGGPRDQLDFEGVLVMAAAAAYSPDPEGPWPHIALPFEPETANLRSEVWSRWLEHDPLTRIPRARDALRQMHWVFVDAGNRDEHGLHFAARQMARRMHEMDVPVTYEEFEGGHRGTSWRYEISLPRLVRSLQR